MRSKTSSAFIFRTVLANFSESKENLGNCVELIANGMTFIPYGQSGCSAKL